MLVGDPRLLSECFSYIARSVDGGATPVVVAGADPRRALLTFNNVQQANSNVFLTVTGVEGFTFVIRSGAPVAVLPFYDWGPIIGYEWVWTGGLLGETLSVLEGILIPQRCGAK